MLKHLLGSYFFLYSACVCAPVCLFRGQTNEAEEGKQTSKTNKGITKSSSGKIIADVLWQLQ